MNFILLLFLVFFTPLTLFIGNRFRSGFGSSVRPGIGSYGRHYLRTMANTGSAMSEQIELDNLLVESDHEE
ncbi:hypothetical protein BDV11DRAFT_209776 [Aspergillus similis]